MNELAAKAARGNSRNDSIFIKDSSCSLLTTQRARTTLGEENSRDPDCGKFDLIAENSTRRGISAHPAKQTKFKNMSNYVN